MDLKQAYADFVDAVIANPTLTAAEAVAPIIAAGPTLDQPTVLTWFTALAAGYNAIGVLAGSTLIDLRDEIVSEGAPVSKNLFNALGERVNELPETTPVRNEIRRKDLQDKLALVPGYATAFEAAKTGEPIFDTSVNGALLTLETQNQNMQNELAALPPFP
jgi:hypothetical protein